MQKSAKTLAGQGLAGATAAMAFVGAAAAQVDPHGGMLRYPDVSETHIAFVYANDIWLVPREGGAAVPLASPPGQESFPRFSPDGETIAFMGNYEGDDDLYTIPTAGGVPTRITHHPATERLYEWTPDGRLIFFSNAQTARNRWSHLFTVDADGGMPEKLPVPYGANGMLNDDGEWLAYNPHQRDARTWKRYRGGMASDIWLFNVNTYESEQITDWEGTDSQPMWHDETVYYLSDAGPEHRLNIWSYNTRTGARRQVTRFSEYDVKWPAIGPGARGEGEIVFQNGPALYLYNIGEGMSRAVDVEIPGDRPTVAPKTIDASEFMQAWGVSSSGKRAVAQARGDIWTLPAENGTPRNLTRTSGVAERDPSWSPDGRWVAYFSDETGEYELYITQSDGKGETKRLTSGSETFYYDPIWSPDSEHILFTDKAGAIHLHTIETGETTEIDRDPWANQPSLSWSHDGRWIAYDKQVDKGMTNSIWLYNTETGERHKVTSDMFNDQSPAFDRKGDYLYFTSNRSFSPMYGELGQSFLYANTGLLYAASLRADMDSPYLPESDEEEWDGEDEADEDEDADENGDDDEAESEEDAEPVDDGLSGVWEGTLTGDAPLPPGGMSFTLTLTLGADGSVDGAMSTPLGPGAIQDGSFNPDTGELKMTVAFGGGEAVVDFTCRVNGDSLTGSAVDQVQGVRADIEGTRIQVGGTGDEDDGDGADDEVRETVEIDLDGFEARVIQLPVKPGVFGGLAVNDRNQLLYVRRPARGQDGTPSIQLFDIEDEDKKEKTVAGGAGAFDISGDGKQILVIQGGSASIQKAAAGGTAEPVVTKPMNVRIDPREEWRQLFTEAWRIQRDFFYDPNMHGVDWDGVREHYEPMLDDCASRADVGYVISEMISELNVGHAYYGGGDLEEEPQMAVGLLGCDYELVENGVGTAYQISRIHTGGPWDADARGPLNQPGVDVKEGDFLLAVNGVPVDTDKDPWAAFQGLVGRAVTITINDEPVMDENARDVVVEPVGLGREKELRYRGWIEENRSYVEYRTNGRVGYIYVPSTGIPGQNDLVRQFYGQIGKEALIIDERWNSGGQIPTRFIELLNRPITNYWARRDGNDWPWPPDAHQGPKCMLINGLAGSGGDAFPAYFRQAGLGKLIGTRTWGGLVGISGNPSLIDNAFISAPTFAYYEKDGTWGIEGHGVDPDIPVVDDPALMADGGDPQLDAAIEHILGEIERSPYQPPQRPAYPDRSGMGIPESDK